MACGVATVMSPVGVNADIIQQGVNGYLAGPDQGWIDCLSLLIESSELRQKIGKAGRDTVVQNYSVNANKVKYLEVLKSLIK